MMRFFSEYLHALVYIEKKVSKYSERQIHHFQHNEVNLKKFNEIKWKSTVSHIRWILQYWEWTFSCVESLVCCDFATTEKHVPC